jgi:hypothetical protein
MLVIALLALIIGISNAHPKHVDVISNEEIEARSSLTGLEADFSNIIVRQGPGPGLCNSGEVLQYSECQCYNLMTSYCWSPIGTFGQTTIYKSACPIGTQCLPSIGNSWTASCVNSSQVAALNVPASDSNCTMVSFTGYGPIQVVSQIVGGCPPTGSALSASYYNGNKLLAVTVYPKTNYWISGAFQAGPTVDLCVSSNSQAISLVSTFTGEITTPCTWCS